MNYWEVTVRLIDNNYDTVLDLSACQPGDKTRWISNYMPELHKILCAYILQNIYENPPKRGNS